VVDAAVVRGERSPALGLTTPAKPEPEPEEPGQDEPATREQRESA
jgi:hypothetical protein